MYTSWHHRVRVSDFSSSDSATPKHPPSSTPILHTAGDSNSTQCRSTSHTNTLSKYMDFSRDI